MNSALSKPKSLKSKLHCYTRPRDCDHVKKYELAFKNVQRNMYNVTK